jgi:hypothetical protein
MSFLIAQLLIDGPREFFTLDTLYGLVLYTAAAKVVEIVGLEILDRLPSQRRQETLADVRTKRAIESATVSTDRMALALRRR